MFARGGYAYLLENKMQILATSLNNLVANTMELKLATLLETRLDRNLQDLLHKRKLPGLIVRLALYFQLLGNAVEDLLERQSKRLLNGANLGSGLLSTHEGPRPARPRSAGTASAASTVGTSAGAGEVGEQILKAAAAVGSSEVGKDVLSVAERVGAARSTKGEPASASVGHGAKAEAWGYAAGAGEGWTAAGSGLGRRGAPSEEELETVGVVDFTLFGVGENLVGL